MPRFNVSDATPKATNRGSVAAGPFEEEIPFNLDDEEGDSYMRSRESFRDEEDGPSSSSGEEDEEASLMDSEYQVASDSVDSIERHSGGSYTGESGDYLSREEGDSDSEYLSEFEGSEESSSSRHFNDEQSRDTTTTTTNSVVEFTGVEAVRKLERENQSISRDSPLPLRSPADMANSGDDLLRDYMDVLGGDGLDGGSDADSSGGGGNRNRIVVSMEKHISQGAAGSHRDRQSDFLLNNHQSFNDNASFRSQSTRQTRRQAVMVAQRLNFLEDDPAEMTYTRQIALYLMKRYSWYNPRLGEQINELDDDETPDDMGGAYRTEDGYPMLKVKPESPCLEAAWAYFEHFTLTRYVYEPKPVEDKSLITRIWNKFQKRDKEMERAERNENILPTKLYDPIWTPHNQLGDWGIGWGLYFATVRGLMVLCFCAGCLSIPNMVYFAGKAYSGGQAGIRPILASSAICTDSQWVPCPTCAGMTQTQLPLDRLGYATTMDIFGNPQGLNITFAIKNNCDGATLSTGMVHFGILIFVLLGLFILNRYLMKMESIFDADEQTAQDYTIVIENPPPDATDPEEWRNFFVKNLGSTHVVAVTVAVDNDDLVKAIVERRETMKMLELLLDPGTVLEMNNLAGIAAQVERQRGAFSSFLSFFIPGIPELFGRVVVLTAAIRGLAQHDYPATKVFVTFETEGDQRRIVQEMAVGSLYIRKNDKSALKDPKYLFRGEHMLYIQEPTEEPNSYRWITMNERFLDRLWQQTLTTLATFASIALVAFIVRIVHSKDVYFSALTISLSNVAFPEFAKILTQFEGHETEAGVQTSMYLKICLFRWVNTAVVITIITHFTSTLAEEGGLISQIYALFFTEIITMNAVQVMDPYGHFMRHVLAPRAKTQDAMNIQMKGLEVELAERYTNLSKIFFLCLWYSSIYPFGFFMSSAALFINYFTDRHSLMRTWKRAPPLGPGISEFSRRYFVNASFLAMAIMSSYFWASFPFDNLCENDYPAPPAYYGNKTIFRFDSNETEFLLANETTPSFRYCNQDFFTAAGRRFAERFPYVPSNQPEGDEWMTDEQESVTQIYGWAAVAACVLIGITFIQGWVESVVQWLWGDSISIVDDQRVNFSDVTNISAYIPHVASDVFSYPLFVCAMDGIGEEVIDWRDPLRKHAYYDLTKDAEKILEGIDISNKCVFSQMKHWPPDAASVPTVRGSLIGPGSQDLSISDSDGSSEQGLGIGLK